MIVPWALRCQIEQPHGELIAAALGPLGQGREVDLPGWQFLFLCFTNRCGSNYLAELLAAACHLSVPGELFNAETVLEHAHRLPAPSLRAYVAHLPHLVGANGWITSKVGIDQVMMLVDAGILPALLPRAKFILLERRDRVAQAISRCIAAQNNSWTWQHPRSVPDSALRYSRAAICAELQRIELANYGFYSFFSSNGLTPLHLLHEDIVANPRQAAEAIGAFIGVPAHGFDPAQLRMERQANAVNAAWRKTFERGA